MGSGTSLANGNGCSRRSSIFLTILQAQADGFGFGVKLEGFFAHLAAPTGLFVTTERQRGIKDVVAINPHCAGAQSGGEPVGFGNIASPDSGGQPVDVVVRRSEDLHPRL